MCENPDVTKVVLFAKPKSYSGFGLDVDVCPAGQGLVLILFLLEAALLLVSRSHHNCTKLLIVFLAVQDSSIGDIVSQ